MSLAAPITRRSPHRGCGRSRPPPCIPFRCPRARIGPGPKVAAAMPAAMPSQPTSSAIAQPLATRALATLNRPASGSRTGRLPPGPATSKDDPVKSTSILRAKTSAPSRQPTVTTGMGSDAANRAPAGSSTHTTAWSACSNSDALAAKYDSMSPWKSRWSWERLVKAATRNLAAATRPSARACDETSTAATSTPASTIAPEETLEVAGLRGGPRHRHGAVADSGPHRSDHGVGQPGRTGDRLDEMGHGGLPVGAGHPDQTQVLRRVAVHPCGQGAEGRPGVGHHQRRRAAGRGVILDAHRRRAGGDRRGHEAVTVDGEPAHRHEQHPGAGVPRVVGDIGHDRRAVADQPPR